MSGETEMAYWAYWTECVSVAAEECGARLSDEQIEAIANDVRLAHDNYGMAFYSPPAGDRYAEIEREWKAKLDAKQRELDGYRRNAEAAVKIALRQHSDVNVAIGDDGEVLRFCGRTERIQ